MTKIASSKQKRQRPVEDEAEMLNPLHYENDVLHVYGVPLKPHADFPWLWSTNSLLAAVLAFQRGNGVSEAALAKFKTAKKPSQWIRSQERTPTRWNKEVRVAGRLQKQELAVSGNVQMYTPKLLNDYALQKINGGRHQGTYLCASLIVAYCRYLHPEFGALVDDFFARGLQGSNSVIAEVQVNRAKNTPTREESKETWPDFVDAMKRHGASVPLTLAEIYVVLFGKTRNEYMDENGVKEPFRDNVDVRILAMILSSQALTIQVAAARNTQGQVKMNGAARDAATMARLIHTHGVETLLARLA